MYYCRYLLRMRTLPKPTPFMSSIRSSNPTKSQTLAQGFLSHIEDEDVRTRIAPIFRHGAGEFSHVWFPKTWLGRD